MPGYVVRFAASAEEDLDAIAEPMYRQIRSAIAGLADNPRPPGVLKMAGTKAAYRIRVGQYRVAYEIHDRVLLVMIIAVGNRDKIYSILKRRRG